MQLFDGLNDRQCAAVRAGDGPVLIIAGPGTGKTKTLTARIAYLLQKGTQPSEIIALTFTNKAAHEMRQRLRLLLEDDAPPAITTFHALALDILHPGQTKPALVTEAARQDIIRSLNKPPALKKLSGHELGLIISRAKTALHQGADEEVREVLQAYNAALDEQSLQDFDDLLIHAHAALQKTPRQYTHVLVDEFQDTSPLQYEILKLLTPTRNFFAIGDPNQSIYAFRGAGSHMFACFQADFPNAASIELVDNYRSCGEVIRLANATFPGSPQLVAQAKTSGHVQAIQSLNEYSEAAYIINQIEQGIGGSDLLKASGHHDVHEPRDYAVLYRTHRAAKTLQRAFAEAGLPYQIAGEGSPYERPAMQTLVALLRHIENPQHVELIEVPKLRPTQAKTLIEKVTIQNDQTVCDLAASLAELFGLHDEPYLPQFLNTLVQFGAGSAGLSSALQHIDDISQSAFYDPTVNAVTLLTIHAAKGLEFEHVFLCASEEGILPKTNADTDEERRLFYVAITRAKQTLNIIYTKHRHHAPAKPSRFIAELTETILPRQIDPDMPALEKRLQKRSVKRAQISLF